MASVEMLGHVRNMCLEQPYTELHLPTVELCTARERLRLGDFDEAIPVMRKALDGLFREGHDNLADLPGDVSGVMRDIWLLRRCALLARARGDENGYCDCRDRYRELATSLGFEGHMKWAEEMP